MQLSTVRIHISTTVCSVTRLDVCYSGGGLAHLNILSSHLNEVDEVKRLSLWFPNPDMMEALPNEMPINRQKPKKGFVRLL